jgi:DNA helicase II / ATP-dependent DNA helicase PcrA
VPAQPRTVSVMSTHGEQPARVANEVPGHLLAGLNDNQRRAVLCLDGPLLVIAGPGSGKTRVLTHRIAALIETGRTPPWAILAVTFTNKAAQEMRERLQALLGDDKGRGAWVGTFHGMCLRILRRDGHLIGLPSAFSIADERDQRVYLTTALERTGTPNDASILRDARSLISLAKNAGLDPTTLVSTLPPSKAWVGPVMESYNEQMRTSATVDFDDILLLTLKLLREHPEALLSYQRRFTHILVDEYQDTNLIQYQIVYLLGQGHGNIAVVGDGDQSIYAWRGSAPEVIDAFVRDHAGTIVVSLEENYRSSGAIVDTCRALIEANPAAHRAHLRTTNPQGDPVRLFVASDDLTEAAWVVGQISASPDGPGAHAVLTRTNAGSRLIEEALVRAGVTYSVIGALRFYDRAEVKDAVSYLRLLLNPRDRTALLRAASSPRRGVGASTLEAVERQALAAGHGDLVQAIDELSTLEGTTKRAADALGAFHLALQNVRSRISKGPAAALDEVINGSGGMRRALSDAKEWERVENLAELLTSAQDFHAQSVEEGLDGYGSTLAFLERVALIADTDQLESSAQGHSGPVQLMTVHASKGREFDHVWVVGVEDGMFPHSRVAGNEDAVAEERRLLFVAASRARRTLTMTRARRRMTYKKVLEPQPSPFLRDLPASVVQFQDSAGPSRGRWEPGAPKARGTATVPSGPRVDPGAIEVGSTVVHSKFGAGAVESIQGNLVTVNFFDHGRKTLDMTLAPLVLA